jgi:hypothetical protein
VAPVYLYFWLFSFTFRLIIPGHSYKYYGYCRYYRSYLFIEDFGNKYNNQSTHNTGEGENKMNQNEFEKMKRENEALKKRLAEEERKRNEETAMAMIWGRSRTRGMRMELGADAALGEGWF